MTQFGAFALGKFAFFLFLIISVIISVSANNNANNQKKEIPKKIVTKMSFNEYCNFFKKSFCSLPNLDVVAIVMTAPNDDTCARELIKKAEDEYGIKKIVGGFNYDISAVSHTTVFRTYDQYGHQKYTSQNDPQIYYTCSGDVVFDKNNLM